MVHTPPLDNCNDNDTTYSGHVDGLLDKLRHELVCITKPYAK